MEDNVTLSHIKIHVLHVGEVRIAPELAFGGDRCDPLKASGIFSPRSKRIWLPVSAYLIEHPKGLIVVDAGWNRDMSPNGSFDRKAQIRSLGSRLLYLVNQGLVEHGLALDEQLHKMGIAPSDIDYLLLTHLDCDHVNGLMPLANAKHILVSRDEMEGTSRGIISKIRYQKKWWEGARIELFDWNEMQGPFGKSFDLFDDGSITLVAIPGHSPGLFAVKISNCEGKFVLLFSDGGYSRQSWDAMITSGIAEDKADQKVSLAWIKEQCLDPACIEALANHDPEVIPHIIEL